jgi:hypothetical protein
LNKVYFEDQEGGQKLNFLFSLLNWACIFFSSITSAKYGALIQDGGSIISLKNSKWLLKWKISI